MHHGSWVDTIRRYRSDLGGRTIPLIVGMAVILWGLLGAVWGCSIVDEHNYDQEQNACAVALIGGLYMLLTGLWFSTRSALTWRRVVGLTVMLAGVQFGTWVGIYILMHNKDGNSGNAQTAFFSGLLVHILGVLYVRRD